MLVDELKPMIQHVKSNKPCEKRKTEDVLKEMMVRARQLKVFRSREMEHITNNRNADLNTLMKQGKLTKSGWYYEVTGD